MLRGRRKEFKKRRKKRLSNAMPFLVFSHDFYKLFMSFVNSYFLSKLQNLLVMKYIPVNMDNDQTSDHTGYRTVR